MAIRDVAAGRKARLQLETRAGTYPTPASAAAAGASRGSTPGRPARTMPSTDVTPSTPMSDRKTYEEDPEFGFRTPTKRSVPRPSRKSTY